MTTYVRDVSSTRSSSIASRARAHPERVHGASRHHRGLLQRPRCSDHAASTRNSLAASTLPTGLLFSLLHFASGATGMLDVNWLTPAKRRRLALVGEAVMFELDYLTRRLTFTRADIASPTLIRRYATRFLGDGAIIEVEDRELLAAQLDAFLAVARGGRLVVDRAAGLWALAISTSLLQSAAEARPIDLVAMIPAR